DAGVVGPGEGEHGLRGIGEGEARPGGARGGALDEAAGAAAGVEPASRARDSGERDVDGLIQQDRVEGDGALDLALVVGGGVRGGVVAHGSGGAYRRTRRTSRGKAPRPRLDLARG